MKLFKTNDIGLNIVKHCQREFNFDVNDVNDLKLDVACVAFSVNICEDFSMHAVS